MKVIPTSSSTGLTKVRIAPEWHFWELGTLHQFNHYLTPC